MKATAWYMVFHDIFHNQHKRPVFSFVSFFWAHFQPSRFALFSLQQFGHLHCAARRHLFAKTKIIELATLRSEETKSGSHDDFTIPLLSISIFGFLQRWIWYLIVAKRGRGRKQKLLLPITDVVIKHRLGGESRENSIYRKRALHKCDGF